MNDLLIKIDCMDVKLLTKEEKAQLMAALAAEQQAEKDRVKNEREAYKHLVDETVEKCADELQALSSTMIRLKQVVFEEFASVIGLKNELFNVKGDRKSDTFTTSKGDIRITLGNRTVEGWDDTVEAGIEKVKDYIQSLAKDDNSAALVNAVMRLLRKDTKGMLKANKVLELERLAIESKNADFIDAINIIKDAYRPQPSCQFITLEVKHKGNESFTNVPLSLATM